MRQRGSGRSSRSADVSSLTTVVGTGTPASCTSDEVVDAVACGGVIVFDCGADPITITHLEGSWYPTYDQISAHDDTPIAVTDSVIGDDVIP
jgi:hypothetical protein